MRLGLLVGYIFIACCVIELSVYLILLPLLHCEERMIRQIFKKNNNIDKEWTNRSLQVVRATKLYTLAPNICGPSVWHQFHVTFLARRIFIWVLGIWKNCGLMVYVTVTSNSTYNVRKILGNRYLSLKCALFFSPFVIVSLCVSFLLPICICFFFPHSLFILSSLTSLRFFYILFISSSFFFSQFIFPFL